LNLRQEKFAKDNGIPRENWYQEKASGAKNDRIELNRLLSILKENDELYVIDASRL
jgi:DNA invertase Pin-like site-specific DNA recombinase